jgi:hypothetical protein
MFKIHTAAMHMWFANFKTDVLTLPGGDVTTPSEMFPGVFETSADRVVRAFIPEIADDENVDLCAILSTLFTEMKAESAKFSVRFQIIDANSSLKEERAKVRGIQWIAQEMVKRNGNPNSTINR